MTDPSVLISLSEYLSLLSALECVPVLSDKINRLESELTGLRGLYSELLCRVCDLQREL